MFCSAVIGALQPGQAERGVSRLKVRLVRRRLAIQRQAFAAPGALQHQRHAVDHDVEEAADQQPENSATPAVSSAELDSSSIIAGARPRPRRRA